MQEEQIEESSALRPVEIPTQEVSLATPPAEPSPSQPVEEGLPFQTEQEPSELAPEEILELTKEDLKEELVTEELPPQPPLMSPQPAARIHCLPIRFGRIRLPKPHRIEVLRARHSALLSLDLRI